MLKKLNSYIIIGVCILLFIFLIGCVKKCNHVDKDDDLLCDTCNESYDDGIDNNQDDNQEEDDNNQDDNQEEDDNNQDDNQEDDGNGDGSDVVIKETIEDVYELVDNVIPSELYEDITLPRSFDDSEAYVVWTSSNEDIVTSNGFVRRQHKDVEISFEAKIDLNGEKYIRTIYTTVKKVELKPLENKKVVFAYLYGAYNYSGINEESLQYIDCINYSFGGILNGKAHVNDNSALREILSFRHQGLRVSLALGGWGADGFSQAVRTEETRKVFADSILELVKKYDFDGVDIDWEYPGSSAAGIVSHPSDKQNLNIFCELLNTKLKQYRSDCLLTMAVPGNNLFDFANLKDNVDYFNLMTYDHSIGNSNAYHHTALYSTSNTPASVHSAVNRLITYGCPKEKIIIGAAFYGRTALFSSQSNMKLGAKLQSTLTQTYPYTQIEGAIKGGRYTEMFDEEAQANYIILDLGDKPGRFITYDGVQSIKAKCNYVKENDLAGIMFWEYTQDQNGTLVKTIGENINSK